MQLVWIDSTGIRSTPQCIPLNTMNKYQLSRSCDSVAEKGPRCARYNTQYCQVPTNRSSLSKGLSRLLTSCMPQPCTALCQIRIRMRRVLCKHTVASFSNLLSHSEFQASVAHYVACIKGHLLSKLGLCHNFAS